MAEIRKLKLGNKEIHPATTVDAIVDLQEDGSAVPLGDILNAVISDSVEVKRDLRGEINAKSALHRKCISILSRPGEVYSGSFMRFPIKKYSTFDINSCINLLSLDPEGIGNDGIIYKIENNILTILDKNDKHYLLIGIIKKRDELIKKTVNGKFIVGKFVVEEPTFSSPINVGEIMLEPEMYMDEYGNTVIGFVCKNLSLQIEIWKKVHRHQGQTTVKKRQWVRYSTTKVNSGKMVCLAYGNDNKRRFAYTFLLRARRTNHRNTRFGKWEYFHAIEKNGIYTIRQSRSQQREAKCSAGSASKSVDFYDILTTTNMPVVTDNKTIPGAINELNKNANDANKILSGIGYDKNLMSSFLAHFNALSYYSEPLASGNANRSGYTINGVLTETLDNYVSVFDVNLTTAYGLLSRINASGAVSPNPVYNILSIPKTSGVTDFKYSFALCQWVKAIPYFDCSSGELFEGCFMSCNLLSELPELDFTSATDTKWLLMGCNNLETIGGFKSLAVNLDLSPCTKLSKKSLLNVINKVENMANAGDSRVLTLGVANLMKLSNEEKALATNKGWTLA